MIGQLESSERSAAAWRREFDSTFAAPVRAAEKSHEILLLIRAAGEALAVRTTDIAGLAKIPRITPLPSLSPSLLGIIAVRGVLFPAYDLAGLLGLSAGTSPHAWILFSKCEPPVGLVFDEFEGQVEIDRECLHVGDIRSSRLHVRQMANLGATQRAIVDVPGLVEEIRKQAGLSEPAKE